MRQNLCKGSTLKSTSKTPLWGETIENWCMSQSLYSRLIPHLVSEYTSLRETTQMYVWQGYSKIKPVENNRILNRNLTNTISVISFFKNVQHYGHKRMYIRWKHTNVLRSLSNDFRIHQRFLLNRNITNIMKVLSCLTSSLNGVHIRKSTLGALSLLHLKINQPQMLNSTGN